MTETNVKPRPKNISIQDNFLKFCLNKRVVYETVNMSDSREGILKAFDKYCIKVEDRPNHFVLVYKSALVSIETY